jgi:hypothetical protein
MLHVCYTLEFISAFWHAVCLNGRCTEASDTNSRLSTRTLIDMADSKGKMSLIEASLSPPASRCQPWNRAVQASIFAAVDGNLHSNSVTNQRWRMDQKKSSARPSSILFIRRHRLSESNPESVMTRSQSSHSAPAQITGPPAHSDLRAHTQTSEWASRNLRRGSTAVSINVTVRRPLLVATSRKLGPSKLCVPGS